MISPSASRLLLLVTDSFTNNYSDSHQHESTLHLKLGDLVLNSPEWTRRLRRWWRKRSSAASAEA